MRAGTAVCAEVGPQRRSVDNGGVTEPTPLDEYQARRNRWNLDKQTGDKLFRQIGNVRLAVALLAVVLAYFILGLSSIPAWLLLLPIAAFVALAVWHSRVARVQTLASRALRYYDRALARLKDEWAGTGQAGERFRNSEHVYADDLDLFGKGSLFELVATTRTSAGEQTLAGWLLAPATIPEAKARQEAIAELRTCLDLRQDLALLGPDIQSEAHIEACERWAAQPAVFFPSVLRPMAAVLAAMGLVLLFGFFAQVVPFLALVVLAVINLLIGFALRTRVAQVLEGAETPGHGLQVLALALARFEREKFSSPRLVELRQRLEVSGAPASRRIHQLSWWIDWMDSSDHILVRAIRPLLLWREQIAMGLENWRRVSGPSISGWLRTIGELEALSSLAALCYERNNWSFPQLTEERGTYVASALRHPLIPNDRSVANEVKFAPPLQLFVVSGSNMSGKSTLLRAVGLNAVLAWAGAPVAAKSLTLSPVYPAASIRVTDSLLDNRSRFFAEITRLRQIVDLTAQGKPVLFLLDEILSGTNSHDRRIGAAAVIRKLVTGRAIGFVTTHDLALAEIGDALSDAAINVHFEDRIVDGKMEFDYKLKAGVVSHSNALELMRAVGLEV